MWRFSRPHQQAAQLRKRNEHGNITSFLSGSIEEEDGHEDTKYAQGGSLSAAAAAAEVSANLAAAAAAADAYKRGEGRRAVEAAMRAAAKKAAAASLAATSTTRAPDVTGFSPLELARRSGDNFNPERFAAPVKAANTSGPGADSDAKPDSGRGLAAMLGGQLEDEGEDQGIESTSMQSAGRKTERDAGQLQTGDGSTQRHRALQVAQVIDDALLKRDADAVGGRARLSAVKKGDRVGGAEMKNKSKIFVMGGKRTGNEESAGAGEAESGEQPAATGDRKPGVGKQGVQKGSTDKVLPVTVILSHMRNAPDRLEAVCMLHFGPAGAPPVAGYHAGSVAVFKGIPSKKYDATNRTWNFKTTEHGLLIERLAGLLGVTIRTAIDPRGWILDFDRIRENVQRPNSNTNGAYSEQAWRHEAHNLCRELRESKLQYDNRVLSLSAFEADRKLRLQKHDLALRSSGQADVVAGRDPSTWTILPHGRPVVKAQNPASSIPVSSVPVMRAGTENIKATESGSAEAGMVSTQLRGANMVVASVHGNAVAKGGAMENAAGWSSRADDDADDTDLDDLDLDAIEAAALSTEGARDVGVREKSGLEHACVIIIDDSGDEAGVVDGGFEGSQCLTADASVLLTPPPAVATTVVVGEGQCASKRDGHSVAGAETEEETTVKKRLCSRSAPVNSKLQVPTRNACGEAGSGQASS